MAKAEILVEGLHFGEGPRWHEGRLWFSDQHGYAVHSVSERGDLRTELTLDDRPSGLGWMPDGSLLVVSMTRRQLLRRDPSGALSLHADLGQVATFHCNDMVVDRVGRAYVGNFGFDLDAALRERGPEGVIADHTAAAIACVAPEGTVSVAARDLHFPNGSVITPDGKTLIVAETLSGALTAFAIEQDGTLSSRRLWAPTWPHVPDGICLDAEGAIWVSAALAPLCLRIAEGGEVLETVETSQPCIACMLGGEDRRTLFLLTAPDPDSEKRTALREGRLEIARVSVPGSGLP